MAKAKKKEQPDPVAPEKVVNLSVLAPNRGARKRRKRLGIGEGSGNGKTCGKGQKGQRSRSGFSMPNGFEGGQMPIHRRLPKVGFTSRKKVARVNSYSCVSIVKLEELAESSASTEISLDTLRRSGLVKSKARVKILGGGSIKKKMQVEAHAISQSAREAIENAGGTVNLV